MKKPLRLLVLTCVVLFLVGLGALKLAGDGLMETVMEPDHRRYEDPITVPPDYTDNVYWASVPGARGLANLAPTGLEAPGVDAPGVGASEMDAADTAVFYIHPTAYLSGKRWNAPLFEPSWAWEMVSRMMSAQGSAFNACCDVYGPHYREATLWSFLERDTTDGLHALDIAYHDISRAFDEFIARHANGRPFIIASHSQGTAHALRLLAHKVNDSELRERLVAAYLIGYYLPMDVFERELTNIPPCTSATDTGCVIHYATFGQDGTASPDVPHWYHGGWEYSAGKPILCTNPLTWRTDEVRAPASEHPGALPVHREHGWMNLLFNRPSGVALFSLPAVLPKWTWAQCRDGILYIEPQVEGPFADRRDDETQNYHTRDFSLFYQALRDNAVLRSQMFALQRSED